MRRKFDPTIMTSAQDDGSTGRDPAEGGRAEMMGKGLAIIVDELRKKTSAVVVSVRMIPSIIDGTQIIVERATIP